MTEISPLCVYCKRLLPKGKCEAFPSGIPDEIFITGEFTHTEKFPGDNGLLFEKDEKAPSNLLGAEPPVRMGR